MMNAKRWVENVVDLADALRALYPDIRFSIEVDTGHVWLQSVGVSLIGSIPVATTAIGTMAIDELRKCLGIDQHPTVPVPLSEHPTTRALLAALEEQRTSLGTVQKALVAFENLLKSTHDKKEIER